MVTRDQIAYKKRLRRRKALPKRTELWIKAEARLHSERLKLRMLLAAATDSRLADDPGEGRRHDDCLSTNELRDLGNNHRADLLRRLHMIDIALKQLSKGRYGRCICCKAIIRRKRLVEDPATSRCIICLSEIDEAHLPYKLRRYLTRTTAKNTKFTKRVLKGSSRAS